MQLHFTTRLFDISLEFVQIFKLGFHIGNFAVLDGAAVVGGGDASNLTEAAVEIGHVFKAHAGCDFDDALVRLPKQHHGPLDPAAVNVGADAAANGLLEQTADIFFMIMKQFGNAANTERTAQIFFNKADDVGDR